jgi:hypothetical protein
MREWVVDGNYVFAAGVTAAIDGALSLAAELRGDEVAQAIQLDLVYAPEPPFNSGTPERAPPAILERARQSYRAITLSARKRRAGSQLVRAFWSLHSGWRKARGYWQFCQTSAFYSVPHVEQSVLGAHRRRARRTCMDSANLDRRHLLAGMAATAAVISLPRTATPCLTAKH